MAPTSAVGFLRTRVGTTLALLTLAFVVSGTAFALITPLFENPDEATHVDMVEHYVDHPTRMAGPSLRQTAKVRNAMAATGLVDTPGPEAVAGLPTTRPDYGPFDQYGGDEPATVCPGPTCQNYQFGHPPSWYLLVAPIAWVLQHRPFPDTVLALRLVNVLFGSVMVWATWSIALSLWPGRQRRALMAAACTACCGPLAAAAASVNNDGLMLPLMAVSLAVMARLLREGTTTRGAAVLGGVVAFGLLTKIEFLVIAVVGLGAVLLAPVVVAPAAARLARGRSVLTYLAVGGIGGLWHLRVILDAHSLTPKGGELLGPRVAGPWNEVGFPSYLWHHLPEAFDRFPGRYGWQLANLPVGMLEAVELGMLALIPFWLVCRHWQRPTIDTLRLLVLPAAPLLLLLSSAYTAWQSYHSDGQSRGLAPRYGYGTIPVLAVMLVAVFVAVEQRLQPSPGWRRAVGIALTGVVAALGVLVSQVVSAHAMYFTSDTTRLFQRAGIVAPLAHVKAYLVVLGIGWLVCIGLATRSLWAPTPLAASDPAAAP